VIGPAGLGVGALVRPLVVAGTKDTNGAHQHDTAGFPIRPPRSRSYDSEPEYHYKHTGSSP
jgi:hypothetical protein